MKKHLNTIYFIILILTQTSCNGNTDARLQKAIETELQIAKVVDSTKELQNDSTLTTKPIVDNCKQIECALWAKVNLSEQQMYLYENGNLIGVYKVSTGDKRHKTPVMDRRFGGRMYLKYTSKKFPGGNYMGLGNMPYVVFIKGGYAIHGTTPGSFKRLGKVASHGCIRLHPDNAKIFYDLIKQYGAKNTWISVLY
jgi:lipoprotein-anchoring transpeptidase ErfK/SrfK